MPAPLIQGLSTVGGAAFLGLTRNSRGLTGSPRRVESAAKEGIRENDGGRFLRPSVRIVPFYLLARPWQRLLGFERQSNTGEGGVTSRAYIGMPRRGRSLHAAKLHHAGEWMRHSKANVEAR